MIKLFKKLFSDNNSGNNPPCIVCEHCVENEDRYECTVRRCNIVTSKDGEDYELCYRARKTRYCKYNKENDV